MSRRTARQFFDQANHVCGYCGRDLLSDPDTFFSRVRDHLIPRSQGGPDASHNRVAACHVCDKLKGSTLVGSLDEAREIIAERRARLVAAWEAVSLRMKGGAA